MIDFDTLIEVPTSGYCLFHAFQKVSDLKYYTLDNQKGTIIGKVYRFDMSKSVVIAQVFGSPVGLFK
jgi:hypothetical protein